MKDVTYKRIGVSLVVSSAVAVVCLTYLTVVNLIPPAIDAILDHQIAVAITAQGSERP